MKTQPCHMSRRIDVVAPYLGGAGGSEGSNEVKCGEKRVRLAVLERSGRLVSQWRLCSVLESVHQAVAAGGYRARPQNIANPVARLSPVRGRANQAPAHRSMKT
jgi:hypothetical protein